MNDTLDFRRTALLLHAMSVADRDWMLARLGGETGAILRTMLDELLALGIPADQALLNRATENITPATHAVRSSGMSLNAERKSGADVLPASALDSAIAHLTNAAPAALAQILGEEPPELVARFLACHDWKWRDGVLEKLGSGRRLQVERLAHSFSACPPRLREVLLQSVAACVAQFPVSTQMQKQPRLANARDSAVQPAGRIKRILTAFKLHRQFSSLKRGAR